MSEPDPPTLDELLDRLEASVALLRDGSVPLEALVAAHQEAGRLAEAAAAELKRLDRWAGAGDIPGE